MKIREVDFRTVKKNQHPHVVVLPYNKLTRNEATKSNSRTCDAYLQVQRGPTRMPSTTYFRNTAMVL